MSDLRKIDLVTATIEDGHPVLLIVSGRERWRFHLRDGVVGALMGSLGAAVEKVMADRAKGIRSTEQVA
jgi:hypothetical protein